MTEPISAGLLDVTRRIAEIRALLDIDTGAADGAGVSSSAATDFASVLAESLASETGALPTAAAPLDQLALPDPSSLPAGFALVPLSALGLGTPAVPSIGAAGLTPSALAVAVPPSAIPAPSAQAAQRVALALAEVGVAESTPGSNDAPRIAEYRTATAGSGIGAWCAYFTSWIGAHAGTPLGAGGQGEGYVPTMAAWLQGEGRYVTPEQATPRPGDLVFFDWERDGELDHIGLVQSVGADGRIHTIEGNADDAVRQRSYTADQIAGYGLLP